MKDWTLVILLAIVAVWGLIAVLVPEAIWSNHQPVINHWRCNMFSLLGIIVIIGYLYVGLAAFKAEMTAKSTAAVALMKAAAWPLTIFHTIQKLYFTSPS